MNIRELIELEKCLNQDDILSDIRLKDLITIMKLMHLELNDRFMISYPD